MPGSDDNDFSQNMYEHNPVICVRVFNEQAAITSIWRQLGQLFKWPWHSESVLLSRKPQIL